MRARAPGRERLFVQIPAYRDRELPLTLRDLFGKAKHPERLRVVVAWQHAPSERLPRDLRSLGNLEILSIPARESRGPNWARRLLQERYRDETHTLFLDSHHRFVPRWDERLIAMFEGLKEGGSAKPILTAYLPSYDPSADPRGRKRSPLKVYPLKRTGGLLTHLTGRPVTLWQWLNKPLPADFLSLHFLFAEGSFNREVRFDPDIYFFGDEVLMGLRAFTHGYDLYHPHRVLGWHLYDRATRTPHWDDHESWHRSEAASFRKMRSIVRGRPPSRRYLSQTRSVSEYERRIGVPLLEE